MKQRLSIKDLNIEGLDEAFKEAELPEEVTSRMYELMDHSYQIGYAVGCDDLCKALGLGGVKNLDNLQGVVVAATEDEAPENSVLLGKDLDTGEVARRLKEELLSGDDKEIIH